MCNVTKVTVHHVCGHPQAHLIAEGDALELAILTEEECDECLEATMEVEYEAIHAHHQVS